LLTGKCLADVGALGKNAAHLVGHGGHADRAGALVVCDLEPGIGQLLAISRVVVGVGFE
jgi:hypothetical protein